MFKWIGTTLVAASMLAAIGCNGGGMQDEQAGGPGADVRTDQDQEPQKEAKTFTASLDQENLQVPAGQETELTVSLERGEQFDQTVTLEVKPPEGITAEPETVEFQAGQQEAKITLKADSGAAVGQEKAVELTFQPETGDQITKQLTVTVVEQQQQGGQQQQGANDEQAGGQEGAGDAAEEGGNQ